MTVTDPSKLPKVPKKVLNTASLAGDKLGKIKDEIEEKKGKMKIFSEVGSQLKGLMKDLPKLDKKEKLQRIGGIIALATLGFIFSKEDMEFFKKGHEEFDESETLEETESEQELEEEKKDAEKKVEDKKMTEEEFEKEYDSKADKVVTKKQSYANMHAIRYYDTDKSGRLYEKPNRLARICKKEKAIPSLFILKSSGALFKDGVGSFDAFRKKASDRLVDKDVKDPTERARQAAVILSCCAVGRFQIVPNFHFKKMGWPTRGEEGLRAMYNFIRSTDRQIALFKNILVPSMRKYNNDIGLVGIAYYAGEKTANAYKRNANSPGYDKKAFAGYGSINHYANKVRKNYAKYKQEFPGLKPVDYAAMCMETNETGKGVIYSRAEKGKGISDMRIV